MPTATTGRTSVSSLRYNAGTPRASEAAGDGSGLSGADQQQPAGVER